MHVPSRIFKHHTMESYWGVDELLNSKLDRVSVSFTHQSIYFQSKNPRKLLNRGLKFVTVACRKHIYTLTVSGILIVSECLQKQ